MMPHLAQFLILYTDYDGTVIRKFVYLGMHQRIILILFLNKI
jgi:hypothetical protein